MAMSLEVSKKAVRNIETMRLIGGGAASKLWGQMFADACNLPVEIMDIKEAGCRGAALNAGIATEIYKDHSSVEKLVHPIKRKYLPTEEGVSYMKKKRKGFKRNCANAKGSLERSLLN